VAKRSIVKREELEEWFTSMMTGDWCGAGRSIAWDKDEILVVVKMPVPDHNNADGKDVDDESELPGTLTRIEEFRVDTRKARMVVASEGQQRWGRTISWGAECSGTTAVFTHAAIPTMTRLRLAERRTLDTLIDAGVAQSRSEALAWCVQQVSEHQGDWIERLREAVTEVERIRSEGPG